MYLFITFKDVSQSTIIFIGVFKKIRDIIEYTDGVIKYTDSYYKPKLKQHKSIKKLFKIIKI
jgi:hypothetical protein